MLREKYLGLLIAATALLFALSVQAAGAEQRVFFGSVANGGTNVEWAKGMSGRRYAATPKIA